jgi:tetratricopeptide (TPR) repeat protein
VTESFAAPTGQPRAEPLEPDEIDEGSSAWQKLVAVLIMVVTLIGAVFAFLETQAGNRENTAARDAQFASVRAGAASNDGLREINREYTASELHDDESFLSDLYSYVVDPEVEPFAGALSESHGAAMDELATHSITAGTDTYDLPDDLGVDWARFNEEKFRPYYAAAEYDKAHQAERDGWSDKSSQLVTAITVLAVALFLLGLSLTVSGTTARLFVITGVVVALAGSVWGATVWARPVDSPDAEAIEAFADGLVLLYSGQTPEDFDASVERFSAAISEQPDYVDAYIERGNAYFNRDFYNPEGPQGSSEALADFQRALDLGVDNFLTWGNLGASQWWLGDYEAARRSIRRAYEDKPDDLTVLLNYAEAVLTAEGEATTEYEQILEVLRERLAATPAWMRDSSLRGMYEAIDLAIEHRPELTEVEQIYKESLLRIEHQIQVSTELYGEPEPPSPGDAAIGPLTFFINDAGTEIEAEFDYSGMTEDHTRLYRVYLDGTLDETLSIESGPWTLEGPEGVGVLTLPYDDGFLPGTVVRVEVFIDGNLLSSGEYEVP